ncbi:MAG: MFS transporter [Bryobacteraceae bacterium]|nr:MFS transporter [Bryobacteraceae bacterium]
MLKRWLPALTMTLVSTISYIDRNTLAVLIPTIMRDTGLSVEQYTWVVAGFSWAYMLANPLWGRLLDRWGVRAGMLAAVGVWTLASTAHAWAYGFFSLLLLRIVLGFGEGATFPGALRTVVQTLPETSRARGTALAYSGGALGAVITPWVVTPIFRAYGWPAAFLFTGAVGAAWLLWWTYLSKRPELRALPAVEAAEPISWRDPRIWAFVAMYSLGAAPLGFVLYTSSIYLSRVFHVAQGDLGRYLWIPPLGWEVGYFFWAWYLDRQAATHRTYARIFTVGLFLSLPFALLPYITSLPLLLFALFFAMFTTGAFIVPAIGYATLIFSTRQTGLIAGLGAGSFSAVTAIVLPICGRLFDRQDYANAFLLITALPVTGYALWRWLGRAN